MDFRVFDFLFAAVLALGIAVAAVAPSLEEPYPTIVTAAFAAGAAAFLYFTLRVKFAGIMKTVEQRLAEEETAATEHRRATEKSFGELENTTRTMRDQILTTGEKNLRDLETMRRNVNDVIAQFNRQLESLGVALGEVKSNQEKNLPLVLERLGAAESAASDASALLNGIRDDLNAFVADEQHFRETMENRLAERVGYLEDFIREKRKSLQI